jgi:hypothetical protein
LLPRGEAQTSKPWSNFSQAHAAYERITPYLTTTGQLRQEGIDPLTTPNITILNYADIVRRLLPPSGNDLALDPGIRDCMQAQTACRGFEIDQRHIDRKRVGNFWLDFLDFRSRNHHHRLAFQHGSCSWWMIAWCISSGAGSLKSRRWKPRAIHWGRCRASVNRCSGDTERQRGRQANFGRPWVACERRAASARRCGLKIAFFHN